MKVFCNTLAALLILMALPEASPLQFTFESPDSIDGSRLNAYWFPRQASEQRSPLHAAKAWRDSVAPLSGSWNARLSFTLDGKPYPSAGIGFQFPEGASADLRSLTAIHIKLRADKKRTVRLSFTSRAAGYAAANDTGANLGYEGLVKDSTVTWNIAASKLAFPKWLSETPQISNEDILAQATAIQIATSCDSSVCSQDSGWIKIDSIALDGVDGAPPAPATGNCTEANGTLLSDFSTVPYKKNSLGGWWYSYTDSSSQDTSAHGSSLVFDSTGNWSSRGWLPDSKAHNAPVRFWLRRTHTYSGYAALETQLSALDSARSIPNLHSISFSLSMDQGIPDTASSVIFHAKKSGIAYQDGKDHQVRIPYRAGTTRWCIALDSLQQPDWVGLWKDPFTPDSLLAFTWEVRLASTLTSGHVGFTLDSVVLHSGTSTGISLKPSVAATSLRLIRTGAALALERTSLEAAQVDLLSTDGRRLQRLDWPAGSSQLSLPPMHSVCIVRIVSVKASSSLMLPAF